jgi:hypothetical protein
MGGCEQFRNRWRGDCQEPGSGRLSRATAGHDETGFDRRDRQHHPDPCASTELAPWGRTDPYGFVQFWAVG